jgi:hypothetical protein
VTTRRPFAQRISDHTASRLAGTGVTRRGFLYHTALVGSALLVAPRRFLLQPISALDAICGPDSTCASGYTVFCCTINNGVNQCPQGTFPGGWWKAASSSFCCGSARYIIDCQAECTGCGCAGGPFCASGCVDCTAHCQPGPSCDQRLVCTNVFRYGQCNQQIGCSGPVACRMTSCTPPWQIPALACTSAVATDDQTAEHGAPCLPPCPPPPPPPPPPGHWAPTAVLVAPTGTIASDPAPAAVKGASRVDVFAAGPDSKLYWINWSGSAWGSWVYLGSPPGGVVGDPAAVSWAPGRLDIFVRGHDDNLWQLFSVDGGGQWSSWSRPLGTDTLLASDPAVSTWGPGRLDIVVVGTDRGLHHRVWDNFQWSASWESLGHPAAGIQGRPAAVSWGYNRLDLFVTGADTRLYQISWDTSAWSGWAQPPGTELGILTSSPGATSYAREQVAVFARGNDNGLWWNSYQAGWGKWAGWQRLGQPADQLQGGPQATSRGNQQMDVFVRGADNRCHQYYFAP